MEAIVQTGLGALGLVWETVARQIVDLAIEIYHANPDQAAALKLVFLRRGMYRVELA
jgi:hypothetical protein